MKVFAMNGDTAIAHAMKQIDPDVVAGYPITPQTIAIERFSDFVANGEVHTEFVLTESEHSAMTACISASAAGARVVTSTSSQGLALMWEMLYIAAGMRVPLTMSVMNRALSAPINIHCDHSDTMGARDAGWIQIFGENVQEGYDNMLQSVRIAEHEDVRLPVMSTIDGFTITHSVERFEALEDDEVKKFIGEFKPMHPLLDVKNPVTHGPFALPDYYFEIKRQQVDAMEKALKVIKDVGEEYGKLSGRSYDLLHPYKMDDAELAVVVMGSAAGTARAAVNELRDSGLKVGLLKIRSYRPFPVEEIREMLKDVGVVAVMDRALSFGNMGGPVFTDIRSSIYSNGGPVVVDYIYGLGGRDITVNDVKNIARDASVLKEEPEVPVKYYGVRGD